MAFGHFVEQIVRYGPVKGFSADQGESAHRFYWKECIRLSNRKEGWVKQVLCRHTRDHTMTRTSDEIHDDMCDSISDGFHEKENEEFKGEGNQGLRRPLIRVLRCESYMFNICIDHVDCEQTNTNNMNLLEQIHKVTSIPWGPEGVTGKDDLFNSLNSTIRQDILSTSAQCWFISTGVS